MYIKSETQIEVRYYETDLMGIVHHSNYIRYFECGRHQFLLDVGLPITELEKSGIMMPVVSVEAHYHTPARMGDILRVVSRVEKEPMARVEVRTTSTTRTATWSATAQWSSASSTATPAVPPASLPPCWKYSARPTWNRLLQKKINNNEKICLHFCF